jgi:hypothetical protein
MKTSIFKVLLSAICIMSILGSFSRISAEPIRFGQVIEVVNPRPDRAGTGSFSELRVADDYDFLVSPDDDDKTKKPDAPPQDGRVITETKSDIVRDDLCDGCEQPAHGRGFPYWALLGLAAIPIAIIIIKHHDKTPTPTPTMTRTPTPTTTTR